MATAIPDGPLSADDLDVIVSWVQELDRSSGGVLRLSPDIIEEGTGFAITDASMPQVSRAIEIAFGLAGDGASRCADYGACSLTSDLAGATGETLAMYESEKSQDGHLLGEREWLPAFQARSLDGALVTSTDLLGQPTLLVPLAPHCSHSFQTLPVLDELSARYNSDELRATLKAMPKQYDVEFWVSPGTSLGEILGSHLVPSHFLIASNGKMHRKFVGFQDGEVLKHHVERWLGDEGVLNKSATTVASN